MGKFKMVSNLAATGRQGPAPDERRALRENLLLTANPATNLGLAKNFAFSRSRRHLLRLLINAM